MQQYLYKENLSLSIFLHKSILTTNLQVALATATSPYGTSAPPPSRPTTTSPPASCSDSTPTTGTCTTSPGRGYFDFIDGLMTLQVKGFSNHNIFYRVSDDGIRIERVSDMSQVLPYMFKYLEEQTL